MERTYTVDELFAAVRRRWKVAAIVSGSVLALAALVMARIPDEFRAGGVVMVEPFTPHPDLVVPMMAAQSLEEKVKSVRAQIYARTLMATAIEELKLYPKEREKGMDHAIEAFRLDTEVHAESDNAFAIMVRGHDSELTARASNRLAELFIEGNLQLRAGKMEREERSAKGAHHRLDLIGTQPFGKDTEVGRLEEQYDESRARLGKAIAGLTPDHPDVLVLRREAEATYGRVLAARTRAAQTDLEARRMHEAVPRSRTRITELEQRMAGIDKLVAAIPMTTSQIGELNRDAEMLKGKVGQLISKKAEAEITAGLELKSGPTEVRVLAGAPPGA